jgi:hypothetical protein
MTSRSYTRTPVSPETGAQGHRETGAPASAEDDRPRDDFPEGADTAARENGLVDLGRLAWLGTVLVCLITVFVLVLQGYLGYAAVTFAVAVSAAINLF